MHAKSSQQLWSPLQPHYKKGWRGAVVGLSAAWGMPSLLAFIRDPPLPLPMCGFVMATERTVGRRCPGARCSCPMLPAPDARLNQPLLCCVWANLSFFLHYAGMYCHLIFMYAILPDKYDLLPGNSSDVHSAPCSNYGSHPWRGGDHGPVVHLPGGSWRCWMPFYASLMLANTKEGEKKKKKDECICIGPVFDSWVSSQRKAGAGRLPGQRGPAPARAWPVPAPRASLTATYTNVFVKPKPRSASFLLPRILYVWQMTKSKQKNHTQTQNLQVCNIFWVWKYSFFFHAGTTANGVLSMPPQHSTQSPKLLTAAPLAFCISFTCFQDAVGLRSARFTHKRLNSSYRSLLN